MSSRNPNGDISVNKKMKAGPTIVEGHVWGMRTHQPNLASFWDQIVEATRNELLSQAARLPEAWVDGQDPCIKGINLRLVLFLVWCLMEFCLKWVALSTIDYFVILQEFLDREKADKASFAAVWMIRPWQTHCCHVRLRKQSGNVQGYVSQLSNYLSVCLSICISIRIYVLPSMYISVWKKKKLLQKRSPHWTGPLFEWGHFLTCGMVKTWLLWSKSMVIHPIIGILPMAISIYYKSLLVSGMMSIPIYWPWQKCAKIVHGCSMEQNQTFMFKLTSRNWKAYQKLYRDILSP